jgi:outer membrane lipase/esterase
VDFNTDLAADLQNLRSSNPGVHITLLDLYTKTLAVVADPGAYGFTNTTDEGINAGPSAHLNEYLFWDGVHPTTAGHTLIAQSAFSALVPEPSGLTLAAIAGVGLAMGVCRTKRSNRTAP